MVDIDDILSYYIEVTYTEKRKSDLYMGLNLSNVFGLKYYEDRLIDLLSNDDLHASEHKMYIVEETIKENILRIIEQHAIEVSLDANPSLEELNEIANFLYIIQNMEDYYLVEYRLSSQDTSKNIIIDLISHLTLIEKYRLMEIVERVDDNLVRSIQRLINDKLEDRDGIVNNYLDTVNSFFEFIDNTECLGLKLYNSGYVNKEFTDNIDLQTEDLVTYLEKNAILKPEHTALDVVSLLMISRDTYEIPVVMLAKHIHTLIPNPDLLSRISTIANRMLSDFMTYREMSKKGYKEVVND